MVDIRILTGWTFFVAICIAIYFGGWFLGVFIGLLLLFGMKQIPDIVLFQYAPLTNRAHYLLNW